MAAFPSYTIVGLISPDACNYPVSGANPDTVTAISADASKRIQALLAPYFPAGVTITQA